MRSDLKNLIRFGGLAIIVALIIAGFPQRLFHRSETLTVAEKRPKMPDFALATMDGKQWRFSEHRGQVVLLNFWATWCSPCREETPDLVRVHDQYRDKPFTIVGVTMDDEPAKVVPAFTKSYRMNYPVVIPDDNFGLARDIDSIPTSLLIDRNGKIAKSFLGVISADELRDNIETLLAE